MAIIAASTAKNAVSIFGRITSAVLVELAAGKTAKRAAEVVVATAVAEAVSCGWDEAEQAALAGYVVHAVHVVSTASRGAAEASYDAEALVAGILG